MSDIHLYWWSIESATVTVTRAEMAPLVARLGQQEMRDAHTVAFIRAVETRTTYTDAVGRRHELYAEVVRKGTGFVTANVLRDGVRMAEWKYSPPRRAGNGKMIARSHQLRTVLHPNLARDDTQGVQAWLQTAEATFTHMTQEVPVPSLRKMCRDVALAHGVPILGRTSMYFCYDDDKHHLDTVLDVIAQATDGANAATVALDDDSDSSILTISTDVYLSGVLHDLMNPAPSVALPATKTLRSTWTWVQAQCVRHERRLRVDLVLTRSALGEAEQWIRAVHRRGGLPSVKDR